MRKKVNVMVGLVAAFIAGIVLGAVVELQPDAREPAVENEEAWVADSLNTLKGSFPDAFPEDLEMELGRAYGPEAMRLFVTTKSDYLDAKARCGVMQ